ncbi:hypothetical protein FHS63_002548 [Azospirillum doebereinerae]
MPPDTPILPAPARRMSRWNMERNPEHCSTVFQTFQTFHSPSRADASPPNTHPA